MESTFFLNCDCDCDYFTHHFSLPSPSSAHISSLATPVAYFSTERSASVGSGRKFGLRLPSSRRVTVMEYTAGRFCCVFVTLTERN